MWAQPLVILPTVVILLLISGCATERSAHVTETRASSSSNHQTLGSTILVVSGSGNHSRITQVGYDEADPDSIDSGEAPLSPMHSESSLAMLEQLALDQSPRLSRLYQEYQAAAARSRYVDKLPDPRLGANIFGAPVETAAGSQRANMHFSQTIPWLGKLNAQQQHACLEAFAMRAEFAAERLRVLAGVRIGWYRLYVIDKQIETAEANQNLLKSLVDVANARIAAGQASHGDVLLGTLELSQLEERLLVFRKQRRGVEAEVNRLIGRPADFAIQSPAKIHVGLSEFSAAAIHQMALSSQPEIEAARIRTQATRWGIEVARLTRRPELTLSASYFFTDDNRPASPIVEVGQDPWAIGVQVSIPLWREKYNAMQNEARWKHQAAHSSVQELSDRYDALILEMLAESERAAETARLYESTILPQALQTLSADQDAYSNGTVEFDRVIRDYRSLLTLQLGYHTAVGDLAIANARIQQLAGQDLPFTEGLHTPLECNIPQIQNPVDSPDAAR